MELKYLTPYLPHRLKYISPAEGPMGVFYSGKEETIEEMGVVSMISISRNEDNFKPLFQPLDRLGEAIKENGSLWEHYKKSVEFRLCIHQLTKKDIDYKSIPYWIMEIFFENHWDIFNLIPQGLAEPIPLDK